MFDLRWYVTNEGERVLQYRTKTMQTLYPFYGAEHGSIEGRYDLVYTEWKDVPIVHEMKEYD